MEQIYMTSEHVYFRATRGIDFKDMQNDVFPDFDYGRALAYLYRRFGPPINGGDDYKSLTEYVLTTESEDVHLWISIRPSDACCIGLGIKNQLLEKHYDEQCREKKDIVCKTQEYIYGIIRNALEELLRPTNVRDVYFNILGKVPDKEIENPVEYSKYSALGISTDYLDGILKS